MDITAVEEFLHVSSYPLLEYMDSGIDISDWVAKIKAAAILGEILRLHQSTKNPLNYVHTN